MNPSPTLYINVKLDGKGILLIGGVVYVAARAGTRKALRQDRKRGGSTLVQNINTALRDNLPDKWGETVDKVVPPAEDHNGPSDYDTPSVSFDVPGSTTGQGEG